MDIEVVGFAVFSNIKYISGLVVYYSSEEWW